MEIYVPAENKNNQQHSPGNLEYVLCYAAMFSIAFNFERGEGRVINTKNKTERGF